jgi:hypothetical protein
MEDEKSVFSGSVSMDPASITLVDVAAFVDDPDRGLTRTFTPLIGSVQARYAYGFSDLIGVSTFVGFGLGENPKENYESTGFWKLGGIADINLSTRYGIPLGLALGARTSSYPLTFDNADGNTWAGLASVAYMGRKDLSITLDAVYEYVPIDYQDVALGYLGYTLGLSYTF